MDTPTHIQTLRSLAFRYGNVIADLKRRMPDGSDEFGLVQDDVATYCLKQIQRCEATIEKLNAQLLADSTAEEVALEAARRRAVEHIHDSAVGIHYLDGSVFDEEVPSFVKQGAAR